MILPLQVAESSGFATSNRRVIWRRYPQPRKNLHPALAPGANDIDPLPVRRVRKANRPRFQPQAWCLEILAKKTIVVRITMRAVADHRVSQLPQMPSNLMVPARFRLGLNK